MPYKLVTAPASEPLTSTDVVNHSRIDVVEDDALIDRFIKAARLHIERIGNLALLTQTWELWLDTFPAGSTLELKRSPLASVTHVKYYNDDDVEATLASTAYIVDAISEPGRIVLKTGQTWPSTTLRAANGVVVKFVAGWTQASDVPATIQEALLLLIGHWYENREAALIGTISKELEFSISALLRNERVFKFA